MSDTELSAFLLTGVFDVCERDGVSAKDVLAAGGTTREIVEVSGATVLRSKAVAMFGALAEASPQPDAAFRAGLCLPIERSPDLVRLFRSAPDLPALVAPLNAALGSVCGGLIGVSVSKDCARLGFGFPAWNIKLEEPFQEAAAGAVVCLLRTRFGPDWKPVRVLVGHKRTRPDVVRHANMQVVHGAPDNAIILTIEDALSGPHQPNSASHVRGKPASEPVSPTDATLADDVRRVVSGRLSLMLVTELGDVSKVFGTSSRTLKRRLSDEGTSLSSIVEEIKLGEAKRLLSDTGLPITEISDMLTYSHLPSFTRAFKRATGRSPSDFRTASQSPIG